MSSNYDNDFNSSLFPESIKNIKNDECNIFNDPVEVIDELSNFKKDFLKSDEDSPISGKSFSNEKLENV
jgi:hypothetical protein